MLGTDTGGPHPGAATKLNLHLPASYKATIKFIENLDGCRALQELNLSHNAITKLDGLSKLDKLRSLNVAHNQLTRVDGIFHLGRLEKLNLAHNQIARVPSKMASMARLQVLHFAHNKLDVMRDISHLHKLENLKELSLVRTLPYPDLRMCCG